MNAATHEEILAWAIADIGRFSAVVWPDKKLRSYQLPAARAIVAAALACDGSSSAVVFSRQSGKDEMLAQALAYLLIVRQHVGGEIVVALPSLIPQGQISMRRLMDRLTDAVALIGSPYGTLGDLVYCGKASVRYMSAGPGAAARGATASLLLVANEAQDIEVDRWDAVFDPMGASTNAPTVFMGTVWTDQTLLARAMRTVHKSRLFLADWKAVARDVPAYGARVRQRISELGEQHPFIRTEYMLLPLEGGGYLFDRERMAQMKGGHARERVSSAGRVYAVLVDVGGGGEEADTRSAGRSRDSTVATVVEVVPVASKGLPNAAAALPVYRVVERRAWVGTNHVTLAAEIGDFAVRLWRARRIVVDATGIGHGLAAMLTASFGERVTGFVFTSASKSELGWSFLGQIGAGRYQEYADDGAPDTRQFWKQVAACTYTVREGPGRLMGWSVPDAETHDDLLLSAALCGTLDEMDWRSRVAVGR